MLFVYTVIYLPELGTRLPVHPAVQMQMRDWDLTQMMT